MRRLAVVILLTGAILSTGCGFVEERKNAALREVGQAALSSVMKIASRSGSSSTDSQKTSAPLVIAESDAAETREPVQLAQSNDPVRAEASAEVTVEAPAATREEIFTFTFDSESIDAAPLVKRIASSRAAEERTREQLLGEAKKLKINRARIEESLRASTIAVANAAPVITAHSEDLALIDVRIAERLNSDGLRTVLSTIHRPASPPAAPSERCPSQARTAS